MFTIHNNENRYHKWLWSYDVIVKQLKRYKTRGHYSCRMKHHTFGLWFRWVKWNVFHKCSSSLKMLITHHFAYSCAFANSIKPTRQVKPAQSMHHVSRYFLAISMAIVASSAQVVQIFLLKKTHLFLDKHSASLGKPAGRFQSRWIGCSKLLAPWIALNQG